jgi:pimeloyl-ACP methyl ester carboxylesterase
MYPRVKEKTEVGRVNAAVEAQTVEIDGLSIRYLAAGEGPPLVLLHGAGDNSLDWRWVLPALARKHRVYAPDLPGSPDSARPAADYSPAFFERFVASYVDALGIGRATFVGNSLGGLVAFRLALSEPTRVTALVLVDSAGLGSAVNPAFPSSARRRYPSGEHQSAPTREPGGGRRCSSRILPEASRASGWPSSAGWRDLRATSKPT